MSARVRNFRRRADDEDENGSINGPEELSAAKAPPAVSKSSLKPASIAIPANPKKQQQQQQQQAPKLLSFADDDQNGSAPRRSSKSISDLKSSFRAAKISAHKITTAKDRSVPPPSVPSNVQPQAGTYTKEALRELQKNAKTLATPRSSHSLNSKPLSEPVVVLKGLVKPTEIEKIPSEEVQKEEVDVKREITSSQISLRPGKGKDSSIPDEETIKAIRAKRERLRQARAAAPDYISLDAGGSHGVSEGLSDEEPEFRGRIAMLGEKMVGGKKGVFEGEEEHGDDDTVGKRGDSDDSEDEEEKIWEEEQFRKGLGKRMDESNRTMATSVSVQNMQPPKSINPAASVYSSLPSGVITSNIYGTSLPLQDMEVSVPQQADLSMKALQENMRRLKDSHEKTMSSLARTDENLTSSLLNIASLEESLSAAGEKFAFMQKLRDFVSILCDFLQHKAPYIEELEEQMQKLHEERASATLERRYADNSEEMKEVEPAINAAMTVISRGGVLATATTAAQAAISSSKQQADLPVKLDEFGRDMNLQKRMDMIRRADGRKSRHTRSDVKRLSAMEIDKSYQKVEGESSTDESESEVEAYSSNRDMLLKTALQVFSDAADEYAQLSFVKEMFEKWKRLCSSSYQNAYTPLSMPAIFSPYARLELLKWDPLKEDADFYDMKWHSLLFNYGLPEGDTYFSPEDADGDLVPKLVEAVALPILHHKIEHCWDILSLRETKNAVSAVTLLANYIPATNPALADLLVAVRSRLSDAIEKLAVPAWTPFAMQAVPNAARVAAYRFGTSVRLMINVCLWKDVLALPVVARLTLDELLTAKIIPHLRSIASNLHDAITRTERVAASLAGLRVGPSIAGSGGKLEPLVDYVMILGKSLEKRRSSGLSEHETSGFARRLKKILVELNEYDRAREVSKAFNLKEAL